MYFENHRSRYIIDDRRPPSLSTTRRGVTPEGSNDILAALAPSLPRKRKDVDPPTFRKAQKTAYTTRAPSGPSSPYTAIGITEP